tara:strand:+ start:530 stop:955 length:426 start_codon:yes stop_codon:yes gene_type:complete
MKGYRIDPKARRITEVTLGDHYEEINESIGSRFFCVGSYLPNEDAVFVDDEGLYAEEKHFFRIDPRILKCTNPAPLCGIGLVLGADEEGNSVDAKIDLEQLFEAVSWGLGACEAEPTPSFEVFGFNDASKFWEKLKEEGLK